MKLAIPFYIPRWLARRLFPKTDASLERRTELTGRAGASIYRSESGIVTVDAELKKDQ